MPNKMLLIIGSGGLLLWSRASKSLDSPSCENVLNVASIRC